MVTRKYLHRLTTLLLTLLMLLAVTACGNKDSQTTEAGTPEKPTDEEVETIYAHYAKGDYPAYVALMQSVDGKPETYRQQMIDLYKQQARLSAEEYGAIKSWKVIRLETHDGGKMINAFISVKYANVEEPQAIMVPMVYDGERWRLR